MRTFSALVVALVLTGTVPALALDPTRPPPDKAAPMVMPLAPLGDFKSEADAFRRGIQTYNQGDKAGAVLAWNMPPPRAIRWRCGSSAACTRTATA